MGVFEKTGLNRLSLVNQWQLPLRFSALFTPPLLLQMPKLRIWPPPQKSPNDAQNLPNAYALPLTSVASGSAESTASEKTTFE
ncbi:hypothetical protein [Pseudomonas laurylsulfatiphila]